MSMNRNLSIAAAVAAALSSAASFAAGPSIATITGTPAANTINVMGSSAIKNALTSSIINNFCGGSTNATVVTSNGTNSNFLGVACTPAAGQATNAGNYNVWVRFEGGSVTGYLPIVNNAAVNEIDGTALTANPITVNGSSAANGTDDSFTVSAGGALVKKIPDLGIGDVEPQALINNNYPNDYSTGVWGPPNGTGMFNLTSKPLVGEVYAVYVNQNSTLFTENPLLLSHQTVASILTHQITNWSQVYDTGNHPVVSGSLAITIVNREYGSGSRAATDILVVGDSCGSGGNASVTLFTKPSANRYFATGDVLKAANSIPGAITYASIDNAPGGTGNQANLQWVSLDGIAPSSLAAAQGAYPFWVEAQYVNNTANTGGDSVAVNNIVAGLQNQQTTSALADIIAIPLLTGANGTAYNQSVHLNPSLSGLVPSGGGVGATVYINPYTRKGITCNNPVNAVNTIP
jgi:ABC-type phosphate transport system substrate-binding protein